MCRIWPGIVKEVPDAKLIVIGSGQLYGDKKLGEYGIAETEYERSFIKFITDEDGKILPSVEFKGILGKEKFEIYRCASVGVANPSHSRETFGLVIVEMATVTLPVVTIKKSGYYDTIINGETGILCSSLEEMQKNIIRLLLDEDENKRLGENAKEYIKKFSPEIFFSQWKHLLEDVYNDTLKIKYQGIDKPYGRDFKIVRAINRFLRFKLHLSFLPSMVALESVAVNLVRKIRS